MHNDTPQPQPLDRAVPDWLKTASAELRSAYFDCSAVSLRSANDVAELAQAFQSPEAFCAPLLQAELDRVFPGQKLDVLQHSLVHVTLEVIDRIEQPKWTSQTLLEAAMHNFEESEAQTGRPKSNRQIQLTGAQQLILPADPDDNTSPHSVPVAEFIKLCRRLDLGQRYQAHFAAQFIPAAAPWQARLALSAHLVDALAVAAVEARIRERISTRAYSMLMQVVQPKTTDAPLWSGSAVQFCQLQMLHTTLRSGHSLQGMVLIQGQDADACLVYMPGEPTQVLYEYDSVQQFSEQLRDKLRSADYRRYFRRFVSNHSKAEFFDRLEKTLSPVPFTLPGQWPRPGVADLNADIGVRRYPVEEKLSQLLVDQFLVKTSEDARTLVVPTADVDMAARERRIAWYESVGLNALGAAGLLVPGVGEVMAAVGAIELIKEVCVGVDDWKHGQRAEALDHFRGVAANVAMLALGIAGGAALTPSPFVQELEPILDVAGTPRLLHPDLSIYASDVALPEGAQPNELGQYPIDDKIYVVMDGSLYEQGYDSLGKDWYLQHPQLNQSCRPLMRHNGEGAWQHALEFPLQWEGPKLVRRLGAIAEGLEDAQLLQARLASGVSEGQLRECHVNAGIMPAALRDTLGHLQASRAVQALQVQLRQGGALGEGGDYCVPLLTRLGRWPRDLAVRLQGADGTALVYGNTSSSLEPITLTRAQLADGSWSTAVVEQLTPAQADALFADSVENTRAGKASALSQDVGAQLSKHRAEVLGKVQSRWQPTLTPGIEPLPRDFPGLSNAQANEIARDAAVEEAQQLQDGQVPTRMAEAARMRLREQRLGRALHELASGESASPDRNTLAFAMLPRLPGWTGDVQLNLDNGFVGGERLAQTAANHATQQKYIVAGRDGYKAFDEREQELSGDIDLFGAVLHALSDDQRQALKLSVYDSEKLRSQLFELAVQGRQAAGLALGQRRVQPWFRAPGREGASVGYALSGRGTPGFFQRRRLRRLFPQMTDAELDTRALAMTRPHENLGNAIKRLEVEYQVLDNSLKAWALTPARASAGLKLRRAWRGELSTLDLSGLAETDLPVVTADFPRVRELRLRGCALQQDPSLLLGRFPNLNTLSLRNNALTALPEQISKLARLKRLDLSYNRLSTSDSLFDPLVAPDSGPAVLQDLALSGAFEVTGQPQVLSAQALQPLTRLRSLRMLDLAENALSWAPESLATLANVASLKQLSLRENLLTLTPGTQGVFRALRQLELLDLTHNPLMLPPDVTGMTRLAKLGLAMTQIREFPPGLLGLMNERVVNLDGVNLANNDITEVPNLADTRFIRLLGSSLARERLGIALHENPLDERSWTELNRAGIVVRGNSGQPRLDRLRNQDWLMGCPDALKKRIDADRKMGDSDAFYSVMNQIHRTAGFIKDPAAYRSRMWKVMEAFLPATDGAPGDGLGVADLREQLFELATQTEATCGDGISVIVDSFEVTVQAWRVASSAAQGGEAMFAPLLKLSQQLYRASLVDEYAVIIANDRRLRLQALLSGERRQPNPMDDLSDDALRMGPHDDEAEIRLLLRNRLAERLGLLEQPTMRYGEVVSQATVDNVFAAVRKRDTAAGRLDWLALQKYWEVYCRKVFAVPFDEVAQRWDDVLSTYEDVQGGAESFEMSGERLDASLARLREHSPEQAWSEAGRPGSWSLSEGQVLEIYDWMREQRWKDNHALLTRFGREQMELLP